MSQQTNAEIVVKAWCDGLSNTAWNEPARSALPSTTVELTATAWAHVARMADAEADSLIRAGFLPGHTTIRDLRETASAAARRHQRAVEWAYALRMAEEEQ